MTLFARLFPFGFMVQISPPSQALSRWLLESRVWCRLPTLKAERKQFLLKLFAQALLALI